MSADEGAVTDDAVEQVGREARMRARVGHAAPPALELVDALDQRPARSLRTREV